MRLDCSLDYLFPVFFIQTLVPQVEHAFVDPKKSDLPGYAILNTSKGTIIVELFKDVSFEVIDKFIDLCEKGHFKGMHFRHVIKHYVIQAGNVDSLGAAEDWTLKGKRYSQLDTRVIKGEDVAQEIEEVDTDEYFQPKSHIGIINVTLKQKI
ncbi:peptidyl-prolyl cis-trans isomerase CYP21-4-like [Hevea brasiliensis]|uniref:peptidyl-prolyl cis-trans isomerase CYP21-4-like n=1 Tax=Hevea brasiliensis TaxID=3981 RepID=UPI0025E50A75|nr:peptidyl-prolyl cis-trans isomerase CYP21-4-like [Hevea brasiliensis]